MRCASERDLCDPDAEDAVKVIREGYLVPMMLLVRSGRDYKMSPKLDRNELVRLCCRSRSGTCRRAPRP